MDYLEMKLMKLLTHFVLDTMPLILIMAPLKVLTLFGAANTFYMTTVTYGIRNILYYVQICLDMLHAESHQKYLVLVQHNVPG